MKRLAILCLCFISGVFAQTTGEIRGTVKDPSDRAAGGVKVSARFEDTGVVRNSQTDEKGEFIFPSLPVGEYTIEMEAEGFKTYVQRYLRVTLGHVVRADVQLEAGEATRVRALEAPVVETAGTQLGSVVNSRAVLNLPLNTRDTYQLLQLQPGVQSQQGYELFAGSESAGVVSVNGGRGRSNNFNVNGGDANDQFIGTPGVQPSPDTIEEFRVLTNLFDAQYGRNSGSIVNVVTKSGTNEFHGSGFEFFRNRHLNTRGFFDTERAKFNQNQFGGTLGGRIVKDRTYFFASVEDRKIRQGISSDLVTVPSRAERGGDFSGSAAFSGTLNDQFLATTLNQRPGCAEAVAASGGSAIAPNTPWSAIFHGNRVPVECFDKTAFDLMDQFVPMPNVGDNTVQTAPVKKDNGLQTTFRVDHAINALNQLSFYYYRDNTAIGQPFSHFQAAGSNVPGFGSNYTSTNQQFNLGDTWAINESTVNEMRFSYFRENQLEFNHPQRTGLVQNSCAAVSPDRCFSDPAYPGLGITPQLGTRHEGVPFIQLNGAFTIGNNSEGEIPQVGNTFHWSDNLSRVIGSHKTKFGIDVRRQRFDQTLYYNVNGYFTFGGSGTNDLGASNVFPDYLLGLPSTYAQGSAQSERVRSTALHLFAQDNWTVSRSLTLNYGIRWELNTPLTEAGRRVQTFRPGQATRVFPCKLNEGNSLIDEFGSSDCGPGTPGESVFPLGLVVPGDPGVSNALTSTYFKALAPRIGLAWSPVADSGWMRKLFGGPGKTSVRMGWGMFYNSMEQLVVEQFSGEPPFGGSMTLSNTMFNTPFLGQDGSVVANPFDGILNPTRGEALDWSRFRPITMFGEFPPHLRAQYSANYNFTIQREIHKDMLLQVGYVGSQGHRLLATTDINYGRSQTCLDLNRLSELSGDASLTCGPFDADSSYTIAPGTIPSGFTLHLPYGPSASITGPNPNPITLVGLRRYSSPSCNPLTGKGCAPDGVPVFGSIFSEDTIANSSYNSLQVSLERKAWAGAQFQAAYTFSKSIDNASSFENILNPLDYGSNRSLSLFDARHRLVFSYHWELPGLPLNGRSGKVFNGWALAGIVTMQSGFPVPITSSDDLELMSSSFFTYPGEPDMVAPFRKLDPRNPQNLAFDPASFQQPSDLGRIGTAPRSVCCGPGINNFDISLLKNTSITERYSVQFRAEVFNAANHAQFSKVDGNISDGQVADGGTFGKVLRTRDPRLIQLALKFMF